MAATPSNPALLRKALEDQPREQLITLIIQQAERISQLTEQVDQLNEHLAKLTEQIGQLERTSHRQAAPFRREPSKKTANPKKPGRQAGHKGSWRQPPEEVDQQIEVPLEGCPKCGGSLGDVHPIEQIIEEIPPITPRRYQLTTYRGQCPQCGPVQSTHPLKTSDGQGAANLQLGPRAKAIALNLNYGYELSKRKTQSVIEQVIGTDYKGVLISDCLSIYDDVNPRQQKCYAHHLKAIKVAQALYEERRNGFLEQVERLLKTAMVVHQVNDQVPEATYRQACTHLEQQADQLLMPSRADPVEEKIANRLRKQRDHLFTFSYTPQVPPTNNRAERQLRPAVMARKLS